MVPLRFPIEQRIEGHNTEDLRKRCIGSRGDVTQIIAAQKFVGSMLLDLFQNPEQRAWPASAAGDDFIDEGVFPRVLLITTRGGWNESVSLPTTPYQI